MLTSLVERLQARSRRSVPVTGHYQAWSTALQQLHEAGRRKRLPTIADLTDWLKAVPSDQRSDARQDLIAAHLHWSWRNGEGQALDSYLMILPEAESPAELPVAMIEDELLARYQRPHGDFPSLRSYEKRFPSRPDIIAALRERCLDGERYLKLHRIGVGAVAVVWEAFDRNACREVAIKEPLHPPDSESSAANPFSIEAKIVQPLEHPGIVGMVEVLPSDGSPPFYVMRLMGTATLSDKIEERHAKLAKVTKPRAFQDGLRDLIEAVARVCDAMDFAHRHGVLHCDLKPENIACTDRGDVAVIDWGLATTTADTASEGRKRNPRRLAGTPQYMAPEQMDGIIDVRTEVFGLGAILYETLTAQPPFSWTEIGVEGRPSDWGQRIRAGDFPRPRKVRHTIPKRLESICLRAMATKPEERYATAAELAAALRSLWTESGAAPWSHLE